MKNINLIQIKNKNDIANTNNTKNKLEIIPDYLLISAYLSFENVLSMQELIDLINKYGDLDFIWTGIAHTSNNDDIKKHYPYIGFE